MVGTFRRREFSFQYWDSNPGTSTPLTTYYPEGRCLSMNGTETRRQVFPGVSEYTISRHWISACSVCSLHRRHFHLDCFANSQCALASTRPCRRIARRLLSVVSRWICVTRVKLQALCPCECENGRFQRKS